jgi:hypothetical protein
MLNPILRLDLASVTARRRLLYAALPLAYIVTGRLGLLLAAPPGYATAVFVALPSPRRSSPERPLCQERFSALSCSTSGSVI